MKVGIIGAGALGSLFGGLLAEIGEEIHMISRWEEHVETINRDGLYIESKIRDDWRVHPHVTSKPDEVGEVDVAFLFVKCPDTEAALEYSAPLIGESTAVVTLQNGLNKVEPIQKHVDEEQIYEGVTSFGANRVGPGHVVHTGDGENVIGKTSEPTAQDIASMLNEATLKTKVVDDPKPYVWKSQFVSVGIKPVAALTELRDGPMAEYPPTEEIMRKLVEEAVAVAREKDIELLEDDPVEYVLDLCRTTHYDSKSSIVEDIENKRQTEIEFINGAIVEYGEELDIPVPYNRMGTQLVKGKEQSYLPTAEDS
jgi:2-dehydropantoate 2-reductase